MQTIHKYILAIEDMQRIMLPHGAEILCAHEQMEVPCIWFECVRDAPLSSRLIRMFGTGHPIHEDVVKYLGTVFLLGGQLVLHVYEGF